MTVDLTNPAWIAIFCIAFLIYGVLGLAAGAALKETAAPYVVATVGFVLLLVAAFVKLIINAL